MAHNLMIPILTNSDAAYQLLIPAPFEVVYQPLEDLTLAPDEFLVQNQWSLISPGTELAFYTGTHHGLKNPGNTWAKYPFPPGYASAGKVIAAGPESHIEVGQTVFTPTPHQSHIRLKGQNGTDYFVLSPAFAPEHAVFARLAAISMTAPAVAPVQRGERVVVIGLGLIGNFAAQHYALAGAQVVGVDTVESRLDIARRCAIEHAILGSDDLAPRVREILGGEPDLVIEATGVPALANVALTIVRRRGRVVLLGSPRGAVEIDIYNHIHARGVQLMGAHEGLHGFDGLPTRATLTLESLELIARGVLQVEPLLTHRWPATDARGAYEMLLNAKDTALGVVLQW